MALSVSIDLVLVLVLVGRSSKPACSGIIFSTNQTQLGGVLDPGLDDQRSDHVAAGRPPLLMHCRGSMLGQPGHLDLGGRDQGGVVQLGREGPEDDGGEGFLGGGKG